MDIYETKFNEIFLEKLRIKLPGTTIEKKDLNNGMRSYSIISSFPYINTKFNISAYGNNIAIFYDPSFKVNPNPKAMIGCPDWKSIEIELSSTYSEKSINDRLCITFPKICTLYELASRITSLIIKNSVAIQGYLKMKEYIDQTNTIIEQTTTTIKQLEDKIESLMEMIYYHPNNKKNMEPLVDHFKDLVQQQKN